ncbi:DUF397 domain-containing protein [Glycomyces buryatensis]|uniref:DUF397 domain-containing protein n=1 Tax=Glycomyces buryatensis TaxID=2570927 RepID=A0A4S8QBI9_9ACTN|nr:DUF397 domain-containing protein [Glycomyces buryatensis]THV41640.1 DUF397 domain-containing protein [Glycomyces buryatensis]
MTVVEFGDRFTWHKAARSADQGGNCVCVATDNDRTGIRDSKEGPTGPALWVDSVSWKALHAHVAR